jgi:hypothetical protein
MGRQHRSNVARTTPASKIVFLFRCGVCNAGNGGSGSIVSMGSESCVFSLPLFTEVSPSLFSVVSVRSVSPDMIRDSDNFYVSRTIASKRYFKGGETGDICEVSGTLEVQ